MTYRVGPKGQVVIPKPLRDELGIEPGDEVTFWLEGDSVMVRRAEVRRPLLGRFPATKVGDAVLADRRSDRARDDKKFG